jgi:predicted AlkP superfamily pyrophosphatase or phosphodiesterase
MTLVVLGIDALDPELVDTELHPHLTLDRYHAINTIISASGEPSTHELWPSIITGLPPEEHGLTLGDDGVAWGNPIFSLGSTLADYVLPDALQSDIGAWLLTHTGADAFRTPATYYTENGIPTVFDGKQSKPIGIPNYVVDPNTEDREHSLRRNLGTLFERDSDATGGHTSSDPTEFYEQCMEMVMIRIARARRALRGSKHELVFSYTSGLDLIGHVSHDLPDLQQSAYDELNEFVGELRDDLDEDDELLLVSDHGLQDGLHTEEAMVAATADRLCDSIESVTDVKETIDRELRDHDHQPATGRWSERDILESEGSDVRDQLEDLGYM